MPWSLDSGGAVAAGTCVASTCCSPVLEPDLGVVIVMFVIISILPSCVNVVPVVVYQRVESLDDLLVLAEGEKRVLGAPLPDLMADQSEVSIYSDQSQLTW